MSDRTLEGLRLAVFSPVPPAPTGVADYVHELLPLLPDDWQIDLFVDDAPDGAAPLVAGRGEVHPHGQWRYRQRDRPYDLQIYQVGNNPAHTYALPYVSAAPGLLVLHDGMLHGSRVAEHLARFDMAGYRSVAAECRPDLGDALGELVAAGLGGPALYRAFPLCEDLVRASLQTVVHGEPLAAWLRALVPGAPIATVGHWREVPPSEPERTEEWRRRLGVGSDCPLIGSFGHIGAAHRLDLAIEALGGLAGERDFRLIVAGSVDEALDLEAAAAAAGIADRVHWAGRVEAADFGALMRACDMALNLRYPTARASSGTMQQLLQLGKPVVIHDLIHLTDIPDNAVARVPTGAREQELASLRAAIGGWLADTPARKAVGAAARAWADREITPAAMRDSYVAAIARTLEREPAA